MLRTSQYNNETVYHSQDVAKSLHIKGNSPDWHQIIKLPCKDARGFTRQTKFVTAREIYSQIVRRPQFPRKFWQYNSVEGGLNAIDMYMRSLGRGGYLYAFLLLGGGLKIGRTKNLRERINQYRGWNRPLNDQILWCRYVHDRYSAECELKRLLNHNNNFRQEPLLGREYFQMYLTPNEVKIYLESLEF